MTLRGATVNDVDALTAVHVVAMPMDPNFSYLFPKISEYQNEYFEFIKGSVESSTNSSNDHSSTMLIEIPDPSDESKKRIVAFATWELPGASRIENQDPLQPPTSDNDNKADNKPIARIWSFLPKQRWNAYMPAAAKARRDLLDKRYSNGYLFLGEMVVHPDFQRRGYGKILMNWGVEKAKQEKWPIATFASVAGRGLYESFGMREAGFFRTQVEGEEEFIDNPVLALDAPAS